MPSVDKILTWKRFGRIDTGTLSFLPSVSASFRLGVDFRLHIRLSSFSGDLSCLSLIFYFSIPFLLSPDRMYIFFFFLKRRFSICLRMRSFVAGGALCFVRKTEAEKARGYFDPIFKRLAGIL